MRVMSAVVKEKTSWFVHKVTFLLNVPVVHSFVHWVSPCYLTGRNEKGNFVEYLRHVRTLDCNKLSLLVMGLQHFGLNISLPQQEIATETIGTFIKWLTS